MNNWTAAEHFDKQQRVLDNARVLWRRNLEQNRRDVVRSTIARASCHFKPNTTHQEALAVCLKALPLPKCYAFSQASGRFVLTSVTSHNS